MKINNDINRAKEFLKNLIKGSEIKLYIIPKAKRIEDINDRFLLVRNAHYLPTGGHLGISKTYKTLKLKYYWPIV